MIARLLFRVGILCAVVSLIVLAAAHREALTEENLQAWLTQLGLWGPLGFMAAYALATIAFLPGSLLTLASGALFGPLWGTLYSLAGATLGAALAFLAARYVAGDWVRARAAGRLEKLIAGAEAEGWRFVAFVRLVPLFPFNFLNYALGLTRLGLWPYTLASFVFMAPGAAAYTYLGYVGREVASGGQNLVQKIMIGAALLGVTMFLPRLVKP